MKKYKSLACTHLFSVLLQHTLRKKLSCLRVDINEVSFLHTDRVIFFLSVKAIWSAWRCLKDERFQLGKAWNEIDLLFKSQGNNQTVTFKQGHYPTKGERHRSYLQLHKNLNYRGRKEWLLLLYATPSPMTLQYLRSKVLQLS